MALTLSECLSKFLEQSYVNSIIHEYVSLTETLDTQVIDQFKIDYSHIIQSIDYTSETINIKFNNTQIVKICNKNNIKYKLDFCKVSDVDIIISYQPVGYFEYTVFNKFFGFTYPVGFMKNINQKLSKYSPLKYMNNKDLIILVYFYKKIADNYPEILSKFNSTDFSKNTKVIILYDNFDCMTVSEDDIHKIFMNQKIKLINMNNLKLM